MIGIGLDDWLIWAANVAVRPAGGAAGLPPVDVAVIAAPERVLVAASAGATTVVKAAANAAGGAPTIADVLLALVDGVL